jgi:hypothetical protein
MTTQLPSFYDSTALVTRPMDTSATIPPAQVPVSAVPGNQIQNLTDGIYLGPHSNAATPLIVYVNTTGTDAPTSGSKVAPYATLEYAIAQLNALYPGSLFTGVASIALQAGQTFAITTDHQVYGGSLNLTFYGDPNYGDANAVIGTGAFSQTMSDLQRPIVTFTTSIVAGQSHMAGFTRFGGSISFTGVQLNLPAAPAAPSINSYGLNCDIVRNADYSGPGQVSLYGSIVNMTDPTAFWGFVGTMSQSVGSTFAQFASQFQIQGLTLSATTSPAPTPAQLTARQYFVKFFAGYAGNNQQTGLLSPSSATSSTASGLINLTWADTEALVVATGKTNQASFPIMFDQTYGFRNYVYGLNRDQQSRPLNIISSRLF